MFASKEMDAYFRKFEKDCFEAYKIANAARKKAIDPVDYVEINLAKNMAERVIGLISSVAPQIINSGADKRIKELEEQYGFLDFRVALQISLEVAQQKFCKFESEREAMEVGIRVGFCYMTLGVVSAPLEGFTRLDIKQTKDGKREYFCLNYSGPVRGAGGTASAVSVLIGDYIRKSMGYAEYDPDEKEIRRCHSELEDYHQFVTNLQYFPSSQEMSFLVSHMPVEVSGDPSEKYEISNVNLKDLPRIPTNRLRSGFCLVYSAGLPLKAAKLWAKIKKWGKDFHLEHWNFLEEFLEIQKSQRARGDVRVDFEKIKPDYTYITDIVAGRPVLGMPLKAGAFRLRYGRCRTSGYSAMSVHPATMIVLNEFLATATQLKVERPGKATALTACDSIDGPIVRLKDGSVLHIDSVEKARKYKKEVEKILYIGDMLACYGDFFDRAHVLVPPGYCPEFWILELEKFMVGSYGTYDLEKLSFDVGIPAEVLGRLFKEPLGFKILFADALAISRKTGVPLHPDYTFFWTLISIDDLKKLVDIIARARRDEEGGELKKLIIPLSPSSDEKRILEVLAVPHTLVSNEYLVIKSDYAKALFYVLGLQSKNAGELQDIIVVYLAKEHSGRESSNDKAADADAGTQKQEKNPVKQDSPILSLLYSFSGIKLRDKAGIFIGARMARPEKAKQRKLTGSPHVLFPVGTEGGKLRSFNAALQHGKITSAFRVFYCKNCRKESPLPLCPSCMKKTEEKLYCQQCGYISEPCEHSSSNFKIMKPDVKELFDFSLKLTASNIFPDLIKGVRGTSNKSHYPEFLAKGFLRAKHNVYVNKDGTVRYDSSEVPITHFKPCEIDAPLDDIKRLGYTKDINGKPLEDANQTVELRPQDIILPCCKVSPDEPADEVFFRVANFVDEELSTLYKQSPYYCLKSKKDLIGHYMLGLAPHTSAATLVRIVGFSKTQGMFTHPVVHAAMRRDCDGDESCFILLMDAFLNFSRKYLPSSRGSTMDAPFVLTYNLNPAEVDDMYLHVDIVWKYPLSFYEAASNYKMPWDVSIKQIGDVLGTENQYENIGFTHDISDINEGVLCSAYKTLPSMDEKLASQMDLAKKISAVDSSKVAELVIEKHFIRDTKGNLRKFSAQQFRCVDCNEKYRRPPLSGKCTCGGKIIFTISEGSIVKYLDKSIKLAEEYHASTYLRQTLSLLRSAVDSIFGKEAEKQESLGQWF
ncbi:MAG: DNA polymerase II large subunit [Candidatus Woesearchaeota archaeon]